MPYFKKMGKKIFGVALSRSEQEAMDREIWKQIEEHDIRFNQDKEASILWMLHVKLGLGPKKLKELWKQFYAETIKLRRYYEMNPSDDGWLAKRALKSIGCNLEEWYNELTLEQTKERNICQKIYNDKFKQHN